MWHLLEEYSIWINAVIFIFPVRMKIGFLPTYMEDMIGNSKEQWLG